MREFSTGATRDDDQTKPDYEGFLSPAVLRRFGRYMNEHRLQADGNLRASDNWQKGIPQQEYLKSLLRHVVDLWAALRQDGPTDKSPAAIKEREDLLCAILFNTQGLLHERLKMGVGTPATVIYAPERCVDLDLSYLLSHLESLSAPK